MVALQCSVAKIYGTALPRKRWRKPDGLPAVGDWKGRSQGGWHTHDKRAQVYAVVFPLRPLVGVSGRGRFSGWTALGSWPASVFSVGGMDWHDE